MLVCDNEIEIKVDSSAAHAFFHRRGVGRMKHIDSRILRLQYLIAAGGVRLKKIPRTKNLADMLTHTPSAKELEVFLPLMSLKSCSERDKELMATKQYYKFQLGMRKCTRMADGRVEFICVFQPCTSRFFLVDCFCVVR